MDIGNLYIEDFPKIIGLAKITELANRYGLPRGLYPIIYFEQYSVQIAIEDEHDFMWIDRKDFEWIDFMDDQTKNY